MIGVSNVAEEAKEATLSTWLSKLPSDRAAGYGYGSGLWRGGRDMYTLFLPFFKFLSGEAARVRWISG